MAYRVGWGEHARHFAVVVNTAKEAQAAADSMKRYCQGGVVIVNDRIGVVADSSLRHLISIEEQQAAAGKADEACANCRPEPLEIKGASVRSAGADLLQASGVHDPQSVGNDKNGLFPGELRDHPTDCFEREAKVIG
jgi:hypothetical protein